jgi:xanthine dehydrogenase molybdopterin-binding subunit B
LLCKVDEKTTATSFTVGDVEAALAASESVVEGSIETTRQEHMYEETNTVLVVPVAEDDVYKLYACAPFILFTQHIVAAVLGVPFNRVHITTKRVGRAACTFTPISRWVAAMAGRAPGSSL